MVRFDIGSIIIGDNEFRKDDEFRDEAEHFLKEIMHWAIRKNFVDVFRWTEILTSGLDELYIDLDVSYEYDEEDNEVYTGVDLVLIYRLCPKCPFNTVIIPVNTINKETTDDFDHAVVSFFFGHLGAVINHTDKENIHGFKRWINELNRLMYLPPEPIK
jgi:hypothetical protein